MRTTTRSPIRPDRSARVTYYWQSKAPGGVFTDVLVNDGVTTRPVTGTTFVPTDLQVGTELRVRAVYTDANGIVETVFSDPTAPVAGVNDPHTGIVVINDTTSTQDQALVALVALNEIDQPLPRERGRDRAGDHVELSMAAFHGWRRDLGRHRRRHHTRVRAIGGGRVRRRQQSEHAGARASELYRRPGLPGGSVLANPTTRIGRNLGGDSAPNVLDDATPYEDWMQGFDG